MRCKSRGEGSRLKPSAAEAVAIALLAAPVAPGLAHAQAADSPTQTQAADPPAQNMEQMRQELTALKAEEASARAAEQARSQRIDALARQLAKASGEAVIETPPPAEVAQVAPAAAPSSGGFSPHFEVYGFAQADYVQDFKRVDQNWDDTLRPSKIPTTKGQFGSDGQSIIGIRQSRLGVDMTQDVAGQPLHVKFEIDLFGTGNDEGKTTLRLRHAYGSWGPLLAGQTNSNFMDIDNFPNVVDYWGPNGMVFVRTPQVRYTFKSGHNEFAVAIEKSVSDIDPGNIREIDPIVGENLRGDEKIPDFTARYRYDGSWGHFQLAGILRRIGYDNPGAPNNEPKGHKTGWGLNGSTNIKTWNKDVLHLSVVYGEGIATYMNDGGTDLGPKTLPGPDLALTPAVVPLLGFMAYYDHYWSDHWSSSFGYSQVHVDNTSFQADNAFHVGQYASANLLFTPDSRLLMGAELLWGQREDKNRASGDDIRLQFTFKYSFSSKDFFR
jgi:hypothetical protein